MGAGEGLCLEFLDRVGFGSLFPSSTQGSFPSKFFKHIIQSSLISKPESRGQFENIKTLKSVQLRQIYFDNFSDANLLKYLLCLLVKI